MNILNKNNLQSFGIKYTGHKKKKKKRGKIMDLHIRKQY